jgi:hypothetical protein
MVKLFFIVTLYKGISHKYKNQKETVVELFCECVVVYNSLRSICVCLSFGDMKIFPQATNNLELMLGPNQHPAVKIDTADRTVGLHTIHKVWDLNHTS